MRGILRGLGEGERWKAYKWKNLLERCIVRGIIMDTEWGMRGLERGIRGFVLGEWNERE